MSNLRDNILRDVRICNLTYKVRLISNLAKNTDDLGHVNYRVNLIELDEGLLEDKERLLETYIHELQHAINERYGIENVKDNEEKLTTQLGIAWSSTLLVNPHIADIITECVSR